MPEPEISEELAQFLASGLAIVVATRDRDLEPAGAVAWAIVAHPDRTRVSVFLHPDAAREMLQNLVDCPEIALDCDLPTSHRACQVKGVYVSSRDARDEERPEVERQLEAFAADLEGLGIPRALSPGWQSWPCTAIEVKVTQLFEQTPGPGTGEPLR